MRTVFVCLLLMLLTGGCKRLSDAPDLGDGTLQARLHFMNGQNAFQPGDIVHDAHGLAVAIDGFRFVGGSLWVQDDQHQVLATFPGNRWVVEQAISSVHPIGALPVGHMHAVVLTLGVPGGLLPEDGSWYTPEGLPFYLELSGRRDADGDGAVQPSDPPVHLLCGREPFHYAMADSHQDVLPGTTGEMAVRIDMARMLEQIDASAASNATPDDSVSLQLARNLAAAISGM